MNISVVIPSRLDIDPRSPYGDFYLDRALASIRAQTVGVREICIGISAHQVLPRRIFNAYPDWDIKVAEVARQGQAAAANEAAQLATGELMAFVEDDDTWEPKRLSFGLMMMERCGVSFVSSNQEQQDIRGYFAGINDYPTPSGWILEKAVWQALGGFDETHRWHLDSDFLGKLTKKGVRRAHLVEKGASIGRSPFLQQLARRAVLAESSESRPLVTRLVNPKGGMTTIRTDAETGLQSRIENQRLVSTYGEFPV